MRGRSPDAVPRRINSIGAVEEGIRLSAVDRQLDPLDVSTVADVRAAETEEDSDVLSVGGRGATVTTLPASTRASGALAIASLLVRSKIPVKTWPTGSDAAVTATVIHTTATQRAVRMQPQPIGRVDNRADCACSCIHRERRSCSRWSDLRRCGCRNRILRSRTRHRTSPRHSWPRSPAHTAPRNGRRSPRIGMFDVPIYGMMSGRNVLAVKVFSLQCDRIVVHHYGRSIAHRTAHGP